jgi:restriction endonuclease EcoRII-like protein
MREQFLGEVQHQRCSVIYIWLGQDQDGFTVEGTATHYDTRENQVDRSPEWRLYYPSNPVTEAMKEGDTLFLARDRDNLLYFIVAPEASTSEQQLFWLFGVRPEGRSFVSRQVSDDEPRMDFAARFVLDEIGIEFEEPEADKLDNIIEKYGTTFPKTMEFSELARLTLPEVRAEDDADAALVAWLDHEEALFRRLERRIVSERLEKGFVDEKGTDVDGFISFSLSVQNRRKSRMGHSLENHIEAVFLAHNVAHVRGATTEHNHKPDFLFPDVGTYHAAPATGDERLTMLGAKSTCKDRWRQVLAEAAKIPRKHLLTLEPGISTAQTDQMDASNLQLVVPRSIQGSYTEPQQNWLWCLGDFISEVTP